VTPIGLPNGHAWGTADLLICRYRPVADLIRSGPPRGVWAAAWLGRVRFEAVTNGVDASGGWDWSNTLSVFAVLISLSSFLTLTAVVRSWFQSRRSRPEVYMFAQQRNERVSDDYFVIKNHGPATMTNVRLADEGGNVQPVLDRMADSWPAPPWRLPPGHALYLKLDWGLNEISTFGRLKLTWRDDRSSPQSDDFLVTRKPSP
jgi:hypothetical protein